MREKLEGLTKRAKEMREQVRRASPKKINKVKEKMIKEKKKWWNELVPLGTAFGSVSGELIAILKQETEEEKISDKKQGEEEKLAAQLAN